MVTIFSTLKDKINDEEYVDSLCYRRKQELKICQDYLSEQELNNLSSIDTAYHIARKRYLENTFDEEFIKKHKFLYVRYSYIYSTEF